MMASGLVFVFTHIDIAGSLPLEIIKDHTLRRAREPEIDIIRKLLQGATYPNPALGIPYEEQIREEKNANGTTYYRDPLARDRWKYWVIAFEKSNDKIRNLEYAAQLLEHDLDFGFTVIFEKPQQEGSCVGWTFMPINLVERYSSPEEVRSNALQVTTTELGEIGNIYEAISRLGRDHAFIERAIKNLYSLKVVSKRSDLRVVGYFSTIEALITHQPRLHESLDSLTHQVKNKMILLKKRFRRKIAETEYFLAASDDKIWSKLYSYRSCIAHGGEPDFQNSFHILVSGKNVHSFLHETVKELIVLGLQDPTFLADLRNC